MNDLFWPGRGRAGDLVSDERLSRSMVAVERHWLDILVTTGIAPPGARLGDVSVDFDLAKGSESGGNGVLELVNELRTRLEEPARTWLHRGLTSQDVLDTALIMILKGVSTQVTADVRHTADLLVTMAEAHRHTTMVGRTLTQQAVPITFGLKVAVWLDGLLDVLDDLALLDFPVQLGGAVGSMAAGTELAERAGVQVALREELAGRLGLAVRNPWHTNRAPITRIGDVWCRLADALGHLAQDVATLSRSEIGELAEGRGGGSSTMPNKHNPVLSSLIIAQSMRAPMLGATLHVAAASTGDERPAGAWHAEWPTLRDLATVALVASGQARELMAGLQVRPERMASNLAAAGPDVYAERAALPGDPVMGSYLGETDTLIDTVVRRCRGIG